MDISNIAGPEFGGRSLALPKRVSACLESSSLHCNKGRDKQSHRLTRLGD